MRRTTLALTVASLVASAIFLAGRIPSGAQPLVQATPTASPTTEPCNDEWIQIDTDDEKSGNRLEGIAVRSADLAFAVGHSSTRRGRPIPLIKRWNGRRWARESVKGRFFLHDADAAAKGPVWAVGEGSSGSTLSSYALKRSSSGTWRRTGIVNPSSSLTAVYDVSALSPRKVWATGTYWNSSAEHRVLIEHWNGRRWRHVSFSPIGLAEDVFARTRDDVWVVGRGGRDGNQVTLTFRYNGRRWRNVPSPTVNDRPHMLNGVVSTSRRRAFAVGSRSQRGGGDHPILMRWNGTRWSFVDVFRRADGALWAISAHEDELVAVGNFFDPNVGHQPFVLTFDGERWTREDMSRFEGDLLRVQHAPNGAVYAVGGRSTSGGSEVVFFRPPLCL